MTDFFISYTQADRAWAEWIAWVLEEKGYAVKIQAWDFRPGGNFVLDMQKVAAEAERTIAVLSPDYVQSRFSAPEWAAAFAKDPTGEKGLLLPIRVREVELEGLLPQIVYIELVGIDEDTSRVRLLAGVLRDRAKPARPPAFPGTKTPRPFPGSMAEHPAPDLPVDTIPDPGLLPAGSRMPFAVNPLFVGRQEDLRTLAHQLNAGETSAVGQIAAASGLGGIGKTQLASEFVHRYGRSFDGGVFWMSFADPAAVPAEVAACGRNLDLHPSYDALPLDQQVRLVEAAWTQPIPRLLVFDNCEDESLLDRWRPRSGGARVLVTSRRPRWDRSLGVRSVPLTTLPREVSIELLLRFRPDVPAEEPALSGIAAELGDLPLALHLAGSFLERYADAPMGQPAAYLKALRRGGLLKHPSLQGKFAGISPTNHEVSVARTFALSIEQLRPEDATDALALALLARAAWFAPGEPIPRELLLKTVGLADEEARVRAEDALRRLTALGLLELSKAGALVIHRLVAELARDSENGEAARITVEEMLYSEAVRMSRAGYPAPLVAWQAHLRAVVENASRRVDGLAARLCSELGYHLWMIGDYLGSRLYFDRALEVQEMVLGPNHPSTAGTLNNLGALLQSQGDFAGARPYYERALSIWEGTLGLEHQSAAYSLNNLGALLRSEGDLAGARPYFERALAIRENVLGSDHPDTATSLNNLGALLRSQGDLVGARTHYERALSIWEKVLGPDHPDTASSLNNLGTLLQMQGDLADARKYYERALAIVEKTLGPEHPDTASSLNNLGALMDSLGDLQGARPYYERALVIREKVLGPDHPDTAESLNNLGFLLYSQGDLAGARLHFRQALTIWEARLGPDHPNTKIARRNLAALSHLPD
jgi:tetratricopeptide (TPR) repeat protein